MKTLSNGSGASSPLMFAWLFAFFFLMTPGPVLGQDEQVPAVLAEPDAEVFSKGVILIAAKEGTTKFSMNGKALPNDSTKANAALSEGALIETGADGKVTLLFSNGTVSTVGPSTKVTLKEFSQEKFDAGDRSMGELTEEPSLSNVKLSLDFGSLIVGTKKLNKESSFDIESSVGTAGIRGTQFQVAQPAGGGFSLDVAESIVAFTPQGAAAPLPVSTGKGLDVAVGAAPVARPIKPAIAQAITQTNAGAFALTANVSLNVVTAKMDEAGSGEGGSDSEEGGEEGGEDGGEESSDDSGGEDSGDSGGDDSGGDGGGESSAAAPAESPPVDNAQVLENNPEVKEGRKEGKIDERTKLVLALKLTQQQSTRFYAYPDEVQNDLLKETPEVAQRLLDLNPPADEALRYYDYAVATRENTLSALSDDLLAASLSAAFTESQLLDLLTYENGIRAKVLAESAATSRRLMDVHVLGGDAVLFYGYDANLRGRILQLDKDEAVSALLQKKYDAATMAVALGDDNLVRFRTASDATASSLDEPADASVFGRSATFVADSHANGNDFLLDGLLEMGEGKLTSELLATGEEANRLLTDLTIAGGITSAHAFSSASVTTNPFYGDAASVWRQVSADQFPSAVAVAVAGREVQFSAGDYYYASLLGSDADTLLVSASSSLSIDGSVAFSGPADRTTRVVFAGGGSVSASSGTKLDVALADLALASRHDLTLRDVGLSAGSKVYLSSLRDMLIENVDVQASDEVRLDALRLLSVDGLRFSEELRSIHMRATTLDLSNLDFPGQSAVRLESLKGGVDGKYPTFGTPNRAYGRVNFIENVRSGGNPLFDRSSFDLHGKNVSIEKIPGR